MRARRAVAPLVASTLLVVACGGGGGFPDAPAKIPPKDPGTIALSWMLVDAAAMTETCAMANATSVVIAITQEGTNAQFGQTFACTLGDAISGSLATASYDLTFSLLSASNAVIATAPAQNGVAVTPDHTTDLGQIVFTGAH